MQRSALLVEWPISGNTANGFSTDDNVRPVNRVNFHRHVNNDHQSEMAQDAFAKLKDARLETDERAESFHGNGVDFALDLVKSANSQSVQSVGVSLRRTNLKRALLIFENSI